jgi:hypothetical protein
MSSRGGSRRCGSLKTDGSACRAWAVRGSDPPRCSSHLGLTGAPAGNKNAERHGFYAGRGLDLTKIDHVVADLAERQALLTSYLEKRLADGAEVEEMARLFALHGQNASRLGRLLRDQRALSGDSADGLLSAIGQALDELSTELGIEL